VTARSAPPRTEPGPVTGTNWTHDTGYLPATTHQGFPVTVLGDGTELTNPTPTRPGHVAGWTAGCTCGWRSDTSYPRSQLPSPDGTPPAAAHGARTGTGMWAEWRHHLYRTLPELIVHDVVALYPAAGKLVNPVIATVVAIARERGANWPAIAAAAKVTLRRARGAWTVPPPRRSLPPRRVLPSRRSPPRTSRACQPPAPNRGEAGRGYAR
jgi:hypothetical protein